VFTSRSSLVNLFATVLLLQGCEMLRLDSGFSVDSELEQQLLQAGERTIPDVQPLALNQDIIDYVERHVDPRLSDRHKVQRLQELLFSEDHLDMQYDETATFTAIETFQNGYANCLSLVNLYVAMARYLGLDAHYQTVQVQPRWNRRGELVVLSEHINAWGRIGSSRSYIIDFTPDVRLQQQTAKIIRDEQAVALYFNNLGVEYLVNGDTDRALEYLQYAVMVDPDLSIGWNNLGSAWNSAGVAEYAEYGYRKAFSLDRKNSTAINNLARYYADIGELDRADQFRNVLDRVHNANPYYHFVRGNMAFEEGDFAEARRHFHNAVRREGNEPDFYFALGQIYEQLGREAQAEEYRMLSLALVEYGDPSYVPSRQRLRVIDDNRSILRRTDAGFTISFQ
jgi:Flp pilus assembly protein TadD